MEQVVNEQRTTSDPALLEGLPCPTKELDDAAVDAAFDEGTAEYVRKMSDARLKAEIRRMTPAGAQVPPVKIAEDVNAMVDSARAEMAEPSVVESASMDAAGNVRMHFRMSPEDRAQAHRAQQDMGRQHADLLAATPRGIYSLFPTNRPLVFKQKGGR